MSLAAAVLALALPASAAPAWTVHRSTDLPLAPAVAGPEATLGKLARLVGLSPYELPRWISAEPGRKVRLRDGRELPPERIGPSEALAEGEVVAVPNELLAMWFGEFGELGSALVSWEDDLAYLRYRGFAVRVWSPHGDAGHECGGSSCAPKLFVPSLRGALQSSATRRSLHGLFITGHGNGRSVSNNCDQTMRLDDLSLPYRLGFVLVNTCSGAPMVEALAAPDGAKYGLEGLLIPPFESGRPESILPPGAQGTRPAPRNPRARRRAS